jgi:prolyl oligopeptidase
MRLMNCSAAALLSVVIASASICQHVIAQTSSFEQPDNYQWLEDVSSPRALAWVKTENERTAKVLEADPRYAELASKALQVLESPDRLASPEFHGDQIYNLWQDAGHAHGVLRRTTLSSYLTTKPTWHTVIDYDSLSKQDHEAWVGNGLRCLYPGNTVCLVSLSSGGEDAETLREFDLRTGMFVDGGFVLPKSKQDVAWVDKDTLLVTRDWGSSTMTHSGYPFVMKLWKRGQPLNQATEVYRGDDSEVDTIAKALDDGNGHRATLLIREVDYFNRIIALLSTKGALPIALPGKIEIGDLLENQLIITLNEDWKPEGSSTRYSQGSVLSLDLDDIRHDPMHLKPALIFAASTHEFVQSAAVTKNRLLITTLDHVQGRAYVYARDAKGEWTQRRLHVPENVSVSIVATSNTTDKFFLSVTGFTTPTTLLLGDARTTSLRTVKTAPSQFNATDLVVEQMETTSTDGTKIPYFTVRRKEIRYDGSNPTLLYAYGGFQSSQTPGYNGKIGKLWLERGGVYVVANIRGGDEFGPAWHDAGLKTNRQLIFDDFAAVGKDLIERKITSPRRLGIYGRSNGGLLMGVMFTQHPEMWNAVVIQVPVLDLMRFEHIAAGASWVGEYGSVSNPSERQFLASVSPYNQLSPVSHYPEPLILTTTTDDRVGPVHARKFAARLREFHQPFLYEEAANGGHGPGADLKEQAKTWATMYTYLTRKLMD